MEIQLLGKELENLRNKIYYSFKKIGNERPNDIFGFSEDCILVYTDDGVLDLIYVNFENGIPSFILSNNLIEYQIHELSSDDLIFIHDFLIEKIVK